VLDEYPELAAVAVVPLGVSAHNRESRMRPHTRAEAEGVVDLVEAWQATYLDVLGRRLAFAADEYYLLTERPFPVLEHYEDGLLHEDGIGMAATFAAEFRGERHEPAGPQPGFFAWVDGAPASGYRAPRTACGAAAPAPATGEAAASVGRVALRPRRGAPTAILTGAYGAAVLEPLVAATGRADVRVLPVENRFFGGNIGVTGLLVGEDLARVLADQPVGHRYLLPDVCLSEGRFLDGTHPDDLPRPVEVVATDGIALRQALETGSAGASGGPR
jgi:NifB/MoaA-like Fe-S oxidoreductase